MPQDTVAQAAQTDDAIGRVLRSNAENFEKQDVMTMAICGFVIAALSLAFAVLIYIGAESLDDIAVRAGIQLLHAVVMAALAILTIKQSKLAGTMLFAMVAAALANNFVAELFQEQVSYFALGSIAVVALFVLGKMYPGLGSLTVLAEKAGPPSGALRGLTLVFSGLAGLMILTMVYMTASFIIG